MNHEVLTSEDVLVYPRELNVRVGGVRHDQAVHDALRDSLGNGVSEQALDLNASSIGRVRPDFRGIVVENVCKCSIAKGVEVRRRCASNVRGPAINLPL